MVQWRAHPALCGGSQRSGLGEMRIDRDGSSGEHTSGQRFSVEQTNRPTRASLQR